MLTPKTGSQSLVANQTAGIQPQNIEENKRNDLLFFSWSLKGRVLCHSSNSQALRICPCHCPQVV